MLKYLVAYRYAFLVGIVSWLALFLMQRFPVLWIFLTIIIVWILITVFVLQISDKKYKIKNQHIPLIFTTIISLISLNSLIEWPLLRSFLSVVGALLVGILFFISLHELHSTRHQQKPWRRMLVMLWVFDTYALVTLIFALSLFFSRFPFIVLAILSAMVAGFSSFFVWRMYEGDKSKNFYLWLFIMILLMLEISWVFHFLPLGHLVTGFFVTWIWYLAHLLIRFNFSEKGILWKRQRWFLFSNFVVYIILLVYFVRWV